MLNKYPLFPILHKLSVLLRSEGFEEVHSTSQKKMADLRSRLTKNVMMTSKLAASAKTAGELLKKPDKNVSGSKN